MVWQRDLFLSPENLRNLFSQNADVGIIAIGMTLVIGAGCIDLSVGSLMALAAAGGVTFMNFRLAHGASEGVAVGFGALLAILTGLGMGLVNGGLVAYGRIASFIATLGGFIGYRSLALVLADGGEIRSNSQTVLGSLSDGGLPGLKVAGNQPLITWPTLVFLLLVLTMSFVVSRATFGRRLLAVGENQLAAFYAGIDYRRVQLAAFGILGLCCGIAAILESARMNSVSSNGMGQSYELDAIAAVVVGGTSLKGGRARVWGTVCGVLILGVINTLLVGSGVSNYWQGLVKGGVILLAVFLQRSKGAIR